MGGLSAANALIVVPPDVSHVSVNDAVTVIDLGSGA